MVHREMDIQRRKELALDAPKNLEKLFHSHKLTITTEVRVFEAYVSSVFLYNSELCVTEKSVNKKIDSFQRRLLRKVLKVKWPRILTNEEVYKITKVIPWSKKIPKRRLTWLGHLLRLNQGTPVWRALKEACRKVKKVAGRHTLTWIELIRKDIENIDNNLVDNSVEDTTFFEKLSEICTQG